MDALACLCLQLWLELGYSRHIQTSPDMKVGQDPGPNSRYIACFFDISCKIFFCLGHWVVVAHSGHRRSGHRVSAEDGATGCWSLFLGSQTWFKGTSTRTLQQVTAHLSPATFEVCIFSDHPRRPPEEVLVPTGVLRMFP